MAALTLDQWYNFSDYSSAVVSMNGGGEGFGGWVQLRFRHPDSTIEHSVFTFNSETNGTQGDDAIIQWVRSTGLVYGLSGTTSLRWSSPIPWLDVEGVMFKLNGGGGFGTSASGESAAQTVTFTIPKVAVTFEDDDGNLVSAEREIYQTVRWQGGEDEDGNGIPPYESLPVTLSAVSDVGLTEFVYTTSDPTIAVVYDGNKLKMLQVAEVTITATQPGDSQYNPASASVTISPPPPKTPQTITITAPAVMQVGDFAPLSYSASSGLPVAVRSFSPEIVEITADGRLHALLPGGSVLAFDQEGNEDYAEASETFVVVVDGLEQTVTFDALPSDLKVGDTATLSATSSAGLPITFTSSNTAVASVSGTTLTINAQGLAEITATAETSAIYNPASASREVVVGQSGQEIYFPAIPTVPYGAGTISIVASSTSGLPLTTTSSNTAVATVIDGTTLQISGVGSTTIKVDQTGNGYWLPATPKEQLLTVTKGDPGLQFTRPADPIPLGDRRLLSASTTNGQAAVFSATGPLRVEGQSLVSTGVGSGSVTATVEATALYNGAAITYEVATGKLPQTISFPELGISSYGDFPFAPGASASSGLPVEYTSSNTNVVDVVGGLLIIAGVGVAAITASQAGNSVFEAAPEVVRQIAVERAGQAIAFDDIAPVGYDGSNVSFGLRATAPGGLVEFRSSNPAVAVVENGSQLVVKGLGVARIIATQAGSANYLPAVAVQSVIVLPTLPSIEAARGILDSESHNSLSVSPATTAPAVTVPAPTIEDREVFSSTSPSPALVCGGAQIQLSIRDTEEHLSNSASPSFTGTAFNMNVVPQGTDESLYSGTTASPSYAGASPTMSPGAELDLMEYRGWLASAASSATPVVARYDGRDEFEVYFAPVAYEPVGFLKWAKSGSTGAIQQYRTNEDGLQTKGKIAL